MVDRQRAHEVDHPGLGGIIGGEPQVTAQAGGRGGADDRALAALDHMRQRRVAGVEQRAHNDRQRLIPPALNGRRQGPVAPMPGDFDRPIAPAWQETGEEDQYIWPTATPPKASASCVMRSSARAWPGCSPASGSTRPATPTIRSTK